MHGASPGGSTHSTHEDTTSPWQRLTRYIASAGISLRRYTRLDALLTHLARLIADLPDFAQCMLSISDQDHFYPLTTPIPDTEHPTDSYPQALSRTLVQRLLDQRHRVSPDYAAYLIPAGTDVYTELTSLLPASTTSSAASSPELVALPLQGHDSLLGLLICQGPQHANLASTLPQLALFADEIAMLLELTHLREEIQRVSDERLALIEVGRALAAPEASQDVQTVYRVIYEQVQRLMPVDAFFISCYIPEKATLECAFQVVQGQIELSHNQYHFPSELKRFFSSEQHYAIYATNLDLMQYLQKEIPAVYPIYNALPDERKPRALMLTAIYHGNEPVGILEVHSYIPQSYQQKHLQMLREIGTLAAAAIKNARTHEDLRAALVKAQESERLKNRFLMTASHELRTPLTAVHGYLEMLDEMLPELDKDLQARFISNARRASEELVLITSTIMDASRLDQDKVELRPEAVRLAETVQTILEILRSPLLKEGREVTVSLPEQLYVQADDLRLRQILLNLLNNALKYTPGGTSLTIIAESLETSLLTRRFPAVERLTMLDSAQGYAVIAICDHGPGISPEKQLHLFSKFTRLDEAINSQQRGAGLGLYLCRQFAEAMGGAIWLESTGVMGEGCIFRLALPLISPR